MNQVQVEQKSYQMPPQDGFSVAHFLTVADVERSLRFYETVFGGRILSRGDSSGAPGYVQIANTWLLVNPGGGPTPDKPSVTLSVPANPDLVSSFMNIRVADIQACYKLWRSRGAEFYQELSGIAQDPNIKEALESRVFLQDKILSSLDRCFKLIGEKPVALTGRLHDVFVEDFKREFAEIQAPAAKALFVLVKANQLMHLRIAEYVALIAMADVTGHFGVGVLLESCLADKVAFVERTRRLIRHTIESKHALKLAA